MKNYQLLFCLSLISYILATPPSGITIDLSASQSLNTGENVDVKIKVTAADNGMVLKALTGLKFQLSSEVSLDLTCTIAASGETCAAGTAKEITCKVATLSTAGTYKLAGTAALTAFESDGTTSISSPSATLGSTTATVTAAANGGGEGETNGTGNTNSNGNSNSNTNGSKFLRVSSILFLLISFLL